MRSAFLLAAAALLLAAQNTRIRPVASPGPKPVGPYSPGLWAGDRFYVSGQGARDAQGVLPATPAAQIRQTLENVKGIIEAAGLTMDHIVFSHTYYSDLQHYQTLNQIWPEYFQSSAPPARATIQVAAMPTGTPFEINAIAVRDRSQIRKIELPGSKSPVPLSPAILTGDRLWISGILGRNSDTGQIPSTPEAQVELAFDRLRRVLGAASLDYRHLIFLNIYVTSAMPEETLAKLLPKYIADRTNVAISTTHVPALPFGTAVGIHGVATNHLRPRARSGNCVGADGTIYCGQFTSDDYRSALVGLPALLQKINGGSIPQIAASYVMMGDLKEFTTMNGIYAEVTPSPFPTRTTVQPMPVGQGPKFRWSVIAER